MNQQKPDSERLAQRQRIFLKHVRPHVETWRSAFASEALETDFVQAANAETVGYFVESPT